jgi:hypothetical protein
MTSSLFYWSVLALCSLYGFWRGGTPERVGMAIVVIGSILTTESASANLAVRFHALEMGMFLVDIVVFFAFVLLALAADRYWPLWVAGLQLIGVSTHTMMLASPDIIPWVYAVTQSLWGYPILLAIMIGTARHRKRLKANDADPSWTPFFARLGRAMPRPGRKR